MRKIDLSRQHNLRDIGGMKTKDGRMIQYGKLFRSGHLSNLSEEDQKIINCLQLTDVVDFRNEVEFFKRADTRLKGITYHNFSALHETEQEQNRYKNPDDNLLFLLDKDNGGAPLMVRMYQTIATNPQGVLAYKNFFNILMQDNKKVLWHCSQGKDRAGIAAFLVEYALGCSLEDCISDYLETNVAMELKIEELSHVVLKAGGNSSMFPALRDVFSAKLEYLNSYIEAINSAFKSLDNFICNILCVNILEFRKKYLE